VTDIAVELVDSTPEGFAGLTLAAVAARAGVAVPSLYKHIGSLAEVRRAVALVALSELLRAFASEHPGLYAATQVAPDLDDPAALALAQVAHDTVTVVTSVLRGFGLADERCVDAVRATRAAVHGFVDLEAHGGFGMPDDVDRSFEALLDVLVAGIAQLART
jgi:AcrR family transcriptional regulator